MARSTVARRAANLPRWRPPYPSAIERGYRAALLAYADALYQGARAIALPAYETALAERNLEMRRDAWPQYLETALSYLTFGLDTETPIRAARRVTAGLRAFGDKAYKAFAREAVGVAAIQSEPRLESLMESWSVNNAKLISSIQQRYHADVAQAAQNYVRMGRPSSEFAAELRRQHGLTRTRAKLIARTETAKLNSAVTRERQEALGLDVYIWRTSRDERVRHTHEVMEGKYCKYSDPTVYADTPHGPWLKRSSIQGYQGDPGTDFQCRCTAEADVVSRIASLRR